MLLSVVADEMKSDHVLRKEYFHFAIDSIAGILETSGPSCGMFSTLGSEPASACECFRCRIGLRLISGNISCKSRSQSYHSISRKCVRWSIAYFATKKRKFIVADTPGHEQFTRNMATGASSADLAIILVDATKGILTQTKRHAFIVSLLGIRHIVDIGTERDR